MLTESCFFYPVPPLFSVSRSWFTGYCCRCCCCYCYCLLFLYRILAFAIHIAVDVCCICLRSGLYPVVWPDGLTVWSCHLSLVLLTVACPGLWSGYSPVILLSGLVTVLYPAAVSATVSVSVPVPSLSSGPAVWSCSCHLVRCSWSDALDLVPLLQT